MTSYQCLQGNELDNVLCACREPPVTGLLAGPCTACLMRWPLKGCQRDVARRLRGGGVNGS